MFGLSVGGRVEFPARHSVCALVLAIDMVSTKGAGGMELRYRRDERFAR